MKDEREAFEAWAMSVGLAYRDPQTDAVCFFNLSEPDAWPAWQARAAASHPQEAALAQPGWKLVPVEATQEMLSAAGRVCIGFSGDYGEMNDYLDDDAAKNVWESMLAAAQPNN